MNTKVFLIGGLLLAAGLWECGAEEWKRPDISTEPTVVFTDPLLQRSYHSSLDRMTQELLTRDFILADVNFNQERRFINFSGDISGRFIEVCSAVSMASRPWPETLMPVLKEITHCQKEGGYFGREVDWSTPVDFDPHSDQSRMMPILWGNGRLLLGLTQAASKFGNPEVLASARKLGDFYVETVLPRFCDPSRLDEYRTQAQFATAYVTCVYEGMEGLVELYRLTQDERYLKTVQKMADFHEQFDTLPVGHSHGSLSQTGALVMLYEVTGQARYLERAVHRWEAAVYGGYVNPCGGVFEQFVVTGHTMDEGCSEADWLRLNLLLWANTGNPRYLDMAERLLWNGFLANQWPTGGFGHRTLASDDKGAYAFTDPVAESYWCCTYHGALALHKLRSYLAVGSDRGISINFPIAFEGTVEVKGEKWYVKTFTEEVQDPASKGSVPKMNVRIEVSGPGARPPELTVRKPEWAGEPETTFSLVPPIGKEASCKGVYTFSYPMPVYLESRFFSPRAKPLQEVLKERLSKGGEVGEVQKWDKVQLRCGPAVLMNRHSGEVETLKLRAFLYPDASVGLEIPSEKVAPYSVLPHKSAPHAFLFNVEVALENNGPEGEK